MKNFLHLVKQRTSVRDFTDKPIEKEKFDYIFEAVRLAPSAVNFQPWTLMIIEGRENVKKLSAVYDRDWFRTAPACIVVCGNHQESWHRKSDGKDHCDIDISIAITHLILAATESGLGTCWVCNFDAKLCSQMLKLPEYVEPIALIPIGYPTNPDVFETNEKTRKTIKQIVTKINL